MNYTDEQLNELELAYREETIISNNFGSSSSKTYDVVTYSKRSFCEICEDMGLSISEGQEIAWQHTLEKMKGLK